MKLISINIEGDKHFDYIIPFLKRENPDVLCLQELPYTSIPLFEQCGYRGMYLPMSRKNSANTFADKGVALFTNSQLEDVHTFYYPEHYNEIPVFNENDIPNSVAHGVIFANVQCDDTTYTIATTHFTWTPDGNNPCSEQISHMKTFLSQITLEKPHIMCGDFNIPRNINPLYQELLKHYTDTIPAHYSSSLDKKLHRHGENLDKSIIFNSFMVDYIFTQSPYRATDVRLEFGLSDHAALIATITQDKNKVQY